MNKETIYIAYNERRTGIISVCFEAEVIGFLAIHPDINVTYGMCDLDNNTWLVTHIDSGTFISSQKCRKHAKQFTTTFIAKCEEMGGKIEYVDSGTGSWTLNIEAINALKYTKESMQQE
jgi:hypothetical protein